jgi:hypothetical protein
MRRRLKRVVVFVCRGRLAEQDRWTRAGTGRPRPGADLPKQGTRPLLATPRHQQIR